MAALQFVDVPGYAALLLRKTYADLKQPGALMPRSMAWLGGTDATWTGSDHSWKFPSGAVMRFGYIDNANDIFQFQSSEFQGIFFDELTQFREHDYRFLFSRLRKLKGSTIPLRMRAASNPNGIGHAWVKRRFIQDGKAEGRVYIPARISDNPFIDKESYLRSLSNLDPVTRKQLEDGDWTVQQGGGMFRREWFEIVNESPNQPGQRWVRFWDLAATEQKNSDDPDWTAGALLTCVNGVWFLKDVRRFRGSPKTNEDTVAQTAQLDGRLVSIRMEQEPGASGKSMIDHYARTVLLGLDFDGVPSLREKVLRAGPFSSAAQAGNFKLVNGRWIADFLDEAESFPEAGHDDQIDSVSGAMAALTSSTRNLSGAFYSAPAVSADRLTAADM